MASGDWLRENGPTVYTQKTGRVRYGGPQVDDPENDEAFRNLSGQKPKPLPRSPLQVKAGKNEPHCATALWVKDHRSIDQDHCLFVPGANPGFPKQVRFNFKTMAASRAMCILTHGLPQDQRLLAIHSCGNGHLSCVNPKHLRWGTSKDNTKDAKLHNAKLGDITDAALDGAYAHPLPKVAAVITGETAESIRAARK